MTRILVADPEEGMGIFLCEELQEEGYDVLNTSPERLRERLEADRPDLVLMQAAGCTRLRLAGLRAAGFPVLVYGLGSWDPGMDPWTEWVGVADAAFDLKRIKMKVRETLRGPSAAVRPEPPVPETVPQAQLQFDFFEWKGD